MIHIPPSTEVNRFVPKEKFYTKTAITSNLRELFTAQVEKITWKNKISPETLNITAGEYAEMQIFEIVLKNSELDDQVVKHIDENIPYPILFVIKRAKEEKAIISYKDPSVSKKSQMKIIAYYATQWMRESELITKGRSVDEIYKNYLQQVAPNLKLESERIKTAIEADKTVEQIKKQVDILTRAIRSELSASKQQELARKRHALLQQLLP